LYGQNIYRPNDLIKITEQKRVKDYIIAYFNVQTMDWQIWNLLNYVKINDFTSLLVSSINVENLQKFLNIPNISDIFPKFQEFLKYLAKT
jgi:hypothetical protein